MSAFESEFTERASAFARDATAWLERHEAEVHGGEVCEVERGNLLAFIAHRIGYGRETFIVMAEQIASYAATCPSHPAGTPHPTGGGDADLDNGGHGA